MAPTEDQGISGAIRGALQSLFPKDSPVAQLQQTLESWQRDAGLGRLFATAGEDAVTAPGEAVELSFSLQTLGRLRAHAARMWVGDQAILECPIPEDQNLMAVHCPQTPGVFEVGLELLGEDQEVLLKRSVADRCLLQVIQTQATIAVDAEHLSLVAPVLRALSDVAFVYFDLSERSRISALREELERLELPPGAIWNHTAEKAQSGFKTLGVDFRNVLLQADIRRARAAGVPMVGMLSPSELAQKVAEREGLTLLSPEREDAADALERLKARARSFVQETPSLSRRLDLMTGTRLQAGNQVHVELDNARAKKALFSAIESAQRSVHLQFYILKDGQFAEHLTVRLINRARAGVKVRVIVDALYSAENVLGMSNPVVRLLNQENGVEVFAAHPISSGQVFDPLYLKQRDHRKLLIVDGERAIVSGRNGGDEYYTGFEEVAITEVTPHERIPWLDAHIEVQGPLVEQIERCFLDTWTKGQSLSTPPDAPSSACESPVGAVCARFIVHHGVEDTNAMNAYEALLDGAQQRCFILNDFPVAQTLAAAVRRAIARGVRVIFLTGSAVARRADGSFFKGPAVRELFEYMTKRRLEGLMRAGVEVYEFTTEQLPTIVSLGGVVRPYVHAKLLSVDGRAVSVGSANLDVTASYWEQEACVIVEDEAHVTALETELEQLRRRSYRVHLDSAYWRSEDEQRRLAEQIWPEALYE